MAGLIAVAIDGSPAGHSALALAARQAKLSGASVVILCSIDAAYSLGHRGAMSSEDETEYPAAADEEQALRKIVADACTFLQAESLSTTCEFLVGHPAQQIVETAHRLRAEMIVMGHRHLSWFGRMLHPSICWDVLEYADCPVLVSMTNDPRGYEDIDRTHGRT